MSVVFSVFSLACLVNSLLHRCLLCLVWHAWSIRCYTSVVFSVFSLACFVNSKPWPQRQKDSLPVVGRSAFGNKLPLAGPRSRQIARRGGVRYFGIPCRVHYCQGRASSVYYWGTLYGKRYTSCCYRKERANIYNMVNYTVRPTPAIVPFGAPKRRKANMDIGF
jgi:hypothetical protein